MKSPNEVCKIVGITRKALRGYVDEGLVTPTVIDGNGYQHFDEDAIRKVILAKVFLEADYTRKQTKAIFESDATVLAEEYDKLIDALRAQQKMIDGQIRVVRFLKIEAKLSEPAQRALESINPVDTYQEQNFTSCLDGLTSALSNLAGEIDSYDLDAYLLFWYSLIVIGLVSQNESDKHQTAELTADAFSNFCLFMNHLDGFSGEFDRLGQDEKIALFVHFVESYFGDDALTQEVEAVCGAGSSQAICRTISTWAQSMTL